jgi:hypothetical protein
MRDMREMEGKRQKGTDREEETERRDGGDETEGRDKGRDRGKRHGKREGGKETEGNRHRERDRKEQT